MAFIRKNVWELGGDWAEFDPLVCARRQGDEGAAAQRADGMAILRRHPAPSTESTSSFGDSSVI